MANVIGQADILIRGDASEFTSDLSKQTKKPAKSWGKRMGTLAKNALGKAMKVGIAGIGVAAGAALIGGFKTAVSRQAAEATLTGLYGSAEKAKSMMEQLRNATVKSPIQYTSYLKSAEALAYAGVEGKNAVGVLKNVGKAITATGGGSEEMERSTDAILKMVNNGGKANLEILQQLSDTGLPIFDSLSQKFGKGTDEISKMASAGKISVDDVVSVLQDGSGKILKSQIKSADEVEKTWGATWNSIVDRINNAVADGIVPILDKMAPVLESVGNSVANAIGNLPETIGKVVDVFKAWSPVLAVVAAALAAWSTGLLIHKGIAIASMIIDSQWLTLTGMRVAAMYAVAAAQKAVNTAMRANPIGLILTAIVALVAGFVLAYKKIGWFRDAVDATWAAIKTAVSAVADWFTDTLWPSIQAVWDGIASGATWLYENGIKPAWDGIMAAVRAVVDWFQTSLLPIIQGVFDAVGAIFTWLYENIVKPVFAGIQMYIKVWWTVVSAIFNALVKFFNAVLKPAFEIFGEVVRVVFQLITGIIQIWWAAVKIVFKAVVSYLKDTLGAAFKWFKDSIITPVWNGIKSVIKVVWDFIRAKIFKPIVNFINSQLAPRFKFLKDTISTVWNAIKSTISTVWNKFIKPVFSAIVNYVKNQIQVRFNRLKSNVTTVWNAIKSLISSVWNKGIKPIFQTLVRFIKSNIQERFNSLKRTVTNVWNSISSKIKGVWKSIKKVAFDPLANAIKNTLPKAFTTGKNAIGKAWDKVKGVAKKPVKFVVDTVINKGIIGGFNKIASKFGVKEIAKFKLPKGFDSGGWTGPGRKLQPAGVVHADEYVIRKAAQRKITRRHGRGALNYINQTGNLPGLSTGGFVPGYAKGGSVGTLSDAARWWKRHGARITEFKSWGQRVGGHSRNSLHYSGRAFDANYGPGGQNATEQSFFDRMIPTFRKEFPKIGVIWRRKNHFNHAHFDTSGGAAIGSGGGGGLNLDFFTKPFTALKEKIAGGVDKFGAFGNLVGGGAKKMIGMPINWIKDNISKVADFVGDIGGGITKGVAYGKGQTWAATHGVHGRNRKAMNWIVSKESGWDPKAQNPRSTASGLPQMINSTARAYIGGAPAKKYGVWKQLNGMKKYVNERYGGWLGAQNYWKNHNYYDKGGVVKPLLRDKGGILPPGVNLVNNATGRNEYVVPPNVTDALMNGNVGGGDTYINVELSVDDLAGLQSALQFVEMLKRDKKTERVRTRMTAKSGEVNA